MFFLLRCISSIQTLNIQFDTKCKTNGGRKKLPEMATEPVKYRTLEFVFAASIWEREVPDMFSKTALVAVAPR